MLWDLFPTRKQLGGAPANFAYITNLFGNIGIPASRVGRDSLGTESLQQLSRLGLTSEFVQQDSHHATGTVLVEIGDGGQPRFEISEPAAWDFLEWTPAWQELAGRTDAVCFGSLAQRAPQSRNTILNFLRATRPGAVRVFDVNLRQHFYSRDVLQQSMQLANVAKLNHEELPRIMQLFELEHRNDEDSARVLLLLHSLKMVCVTRGAEGSILMSPYASSKHPGFRVRVVDTVGAGDAFTAALLRGYLAGAPLEEINDTANRIGAWVASQAGATPALNAASLEETLAGIA